MGCCFSKKQQILLETTKPEIGQYADILEPNINYYNPIHYDKSISDNVVI